MNKKEVDLKTVLKGIGVIIALILIAYFWYIAIPIIVAILLWKKKWFSTRNSYIVGIFVAIIFISLGAVNAHANRAPTIKVTESNSSVQASTTVIKGTLDPTTATLSANGISVPVDSSGDFIYTFPLPNESNSLTLEAHNKDKAQSTTLAITRVFTDEEKATKAKAQADEAARIKAEQDAQVAQIKADQAAYEKTPGGKVCTKHPGWDKDLCDLIAKGKAQIGMTKEQAIAAWGRPDDVNKTTTTYGTHEQWVYGYSSYLYFDDGVLSSIQN